MGKTLKEKWMQFLTHLLMKDVTPYPHSLPLSDFERLRYEIKPCDVLLVEGQSRVSEVIRLVTQSPWTHSMLYIGKLRDIENPRLRSHVGAVFTGSDDDQLVIESLLGKGTIVTPLKYYRNMHIRICRPDGISREDAQKVMAYAISKLGMEYDVRQILDLARLLFPWSFLPRRWRSSLFTFNAGNSTRQVCSSLLAEAFASVRFPILPVLKHTPTNELALLQRNPRLFTPSDFDYSPFFNIIKYPIYELSEKAIYRHLPWAEDELLINDDGSFIKRTDDKKDKDPLKSDSPH
jgi:hypothetical protein